MCQDRLNACNCPITEDRDDFLVELDGMIEATQEFIADDGLRADDSRIHDLSALLHVRKLYLEVFVQEDFVEPSPDPGWMNE